MPGFDPTPDAPRSFGYKIFWFAVRTADPATVVAALDLGEPIRANWETGLDAAYGDQNSAGTEPWIFVSPPVAGWVLVAGARLPYPVGIDEHAEIGERFDALFGRLTTRFDDVQFFGSYRVVDLVAWARARGGRPERIFGFADGGVLANFGEQTPEEAQLGFLDLGGLAPEDAGDRIFAAAEARDLEEERLIAGGMSHREAVERLREGGRDPFPDENDAIDLAALWSLDPSRLSEQEHPPGTGFALLLPEELAA